MKGQTIIELTDVNTMKKEVYRDDNMMTKALQYYFANGGFLNEVNVDKNNMVEELLGGIMLFDTAIPEDEDTVYVPAGINMIGNGSVGEVSNDNVVEMGSYNSVESGWQEDGSYVEVYDFSTTQANGTIACCCLTSKNHGYVGEGNSLSNEAKSTYRTLAAIKGNETVITGVGNYIVRVSYEDSTVTVIDTENANYSTDTADKHFSVTKKLLLKTYRLPLKQINIKGTMSAPVLLDVTEIDIPEQFLSAVGTSNNWTMTYDSECNAYMVYHNISYSNLFGETYPIYVLKIATDNSVTEYKVLNTTGEDIQYVREITIEKGHIFFADSSGPDSIYKINLDNFVSEKISLPIKIWKKDYKWRLSDGVLNHSEYRMDLLNGKVYKNNGAIYINGYYTYKGANRVLGNPLLTWSLGNTFGSDGGLCIWRHSDYIASINNLDVPVTKTADKTMKVSYRITF